MAAPTHQRGLRAVAVLEAGKGLIVLVAGFGLLALLGRNTEQFAAHLVARLHLNPAHHYPHIFISALADVDNPQLLLLAGLAALYATIRFIEAYGLWHQRRWAEWLAALSGGIYVPLELYEIAQHVTWLRVAALAINLLIVGYMVWLLAERRRHARRAARA